MFRPPSRNSLPRISNRPSTILDHQSESIPQELADLQSCLSVNKHGTSVPSAVQSVVRQKKEVVRKYKKVNKHTQVSKPKRKKKIALSPPKEEESGAYRTMAQMLESDDVSWDEDHRSEIEQ